jgi:Tol biopolymer transport system component
MAQPFDPAKMTLSGEPAQVAQGADSYPSATYAMFSVSNSGAIVFRVGGGLSRASLTWVDSQGKPLGTVGEPGEYNSTALSPDGSRIAVSMGPPGAADIWILDAASGSPSRFTFTSNNSSPLWSPDGKNIVFASRRQGGAGLYVKSAAGSAQERLLLKKDAVFATGWTKDGRSLLLQNTLSMNIGPEVSVLPITEADPKPRVVARDEFPVVSSALSPDGRWLAYSTIEPTGYEVYVRPLMPDGAPSAKYLASTGNAAVCPRWRADSKQLFYSTLDGELMVVDIDIGSSFKPGVPRRLFANPAATVSIPVNVAPDGKRFLIVQQQQASRTTPFTVLLNWQSALKK